MALDKVLKVYDDNGNEIDYDILAKDVKFLPDGKDLPTKLAELEDEIGQGGYAPPQGGIPKTDLAKSVQDSLDKADSALQDEDVAEVAKTGDYNDLEHKPTIPDTSNLATKTELQQGLGEKQDTLVAGNGIVIAQDGKTVSVDAEVVQPETADGTFTIRIGNNEYTVNLNHTHENMAKLVVDTAANLPDMSEMDSDTIYGEVDDGEIATIYLGGIPFYGGGGGTSEPVLRRPADGSTINVGQTVNGSASYPLNIKGKNLTQPLIVEFGSGSTGYSFDTTNLPTGVTYDSGTGKLTITAAAANAINGVRIVIVYTGNDTDENASGTLGITSAAPDSISIEATLVANKVTYEDLAGVKLTGTQWMQTDYYPNANTEWRLECKFTAVTGRTDSSTNGNGTKILRCFYDTSGQERFTLHTALGGVGTNQPYYFFYMNKAGAGNQKEINMRSYADEMVADHAVLSYTKGSSAGTLTFNGGTPRSVTTALQTETLTSPMCIGYDHVLQIPFNVFDLTIYELKITENGTVVRDWVPKKRDGVTGLLDIATNGTGTFLSSETAKTSGLTSDELVAIPLT